MPLRRWTATRAACRRTCAPREKLPRRCWRRCCWRLHRCALYLACSTAAVDPGSSTAALQISCCLHSDALIRTPDGIDAFANFQASSRA